MASNEITFKVKVQKDGNLSVVAKEAEKAAKSTSKLGTETDKTTKARNRFNKAEKGVGQAGLSSGKAFAKMNQTMGGGGGLVAAYAVLAANIFALTAAFGALSRAAQVEKLKEGMVAMGRASGVAMNALSENLVKATGYAISLEEAMRTTAQVTSAGFDPSVIERLGVVAKMASQALGRDLGDAMQRITKGAIKMEPELLDELGIMVRLDDATELYAAGLNKSADDLTKFEKQQAFMNAVLEEGEAKFSALGDVDVNPYTVLSATFTDLATSMLNFLNNALVPVVKILGGSGTILVGALLIFASTIGKIVQPAMTAFTTKLGSMAKASATAAIEQTKLTATTGKGSKQVLVLKQALRKGDASIEQWNKGLNASVRSMAGYSRALDNNIKNTGRFSTATWASRKSLRQAKQDHYGLIQAKAALDIATIKNSQTNAMNTLQTQGTIAGLRVLGGEMARLYLITFRSTAQMGLFTRALSAVKGVAIAAATGFAVLGAAILASLNVIGLLIMAGYLAMEAWEWFTDRKKTDKDRALTSAVEASQVAVKDLISNLDELDDAMAGNESSIKGVVGKYEAMNNIMSTTIAEYHKIAKAQMASDKEKGIDGDTVQRLNRAGIFMKNLGNSSEFMKKALQDAGVDMNALNAGTLTMNQLNAAMKIADKTTKETSAQFVGMAKGIEGMNEPLTKFMNKMKETTSVDDLVNSFEDIGKVLLSENNPFDAFENLAAFSERASDSQLKLLGTTKKQITAIKEDEKAQKKLLATLKTRFRETKKLFEVEQSQQILYKQNLKNLKLEISLAKSRAGVEGSAAAQFDLELEVRSETARRMQENIDLQKSLNEGAKEGSNIAKMILGLERELEVYNKLKPTREDRALVVAKEALSIAQASQKAKGEELKILEKMQNIQSKMMDFNDAAAARAQRDRNRRNANRGYDPTLNAADKLALEKRTVKNVTSLDEKLNVVNLGEGTAADARLEAARSDLNIAFMRLDLERQVSLLRLNVLDAEMRVLHQKKIDARNAAVMKKYGTTSGGGAGELMYGTFEDSGGAGVIKKIRAMAQAGGTLDAANKALLNATFDDIKGKLKAKTADLESEQRTQILGAGGNTTSEIVTAQGEAGGIGALEHTSDKIQAVSNAMGPMIETLSQLGPEGALISSVSQGAMAVAGSWAHVGEVFAMVGEDLASGPERAAAVLGAVSATMSSISDIMSASSNNRIASIDQEINAEKKRDGKSAESIAKIKKLEAKKVAAQRKAFEINKKMQIAQVAINTAAAMVSAAAAAASAAAGSGPAAPITFASVFAGMGGVIAAIGAATIGVIMGTSFQGGGSAASAPSGSPGSVSIGERGKSSDLSKSQSARGELAYFRGEQGMGGAESFRGAFYGKKHRAAGGNTGYVVGEQGPELFMPDRPGTIVPADDTAGVGGATNVTFSINAIDAAGVEDVLIQQQGNIIGMLRQAANSYGEDFMEDIDETTYTTPIAAGGAQRWGS